MNDIAVKEEPMPEIKVETEPMPGIIVDTEPMPEIKVETELMAEIKVEREPMPRIKVETEPICVPGPSPKIVKKEPIEDIPLKSVGTDENICSDKHPSGKSEKRKNRRRRTVEKLSDVANVSLEQLINTNSESTPKSCTLGKNHSSVIYAAFRQLMNSISKSTT